MIVFIVGGWILPFAASAVMVARLVGFVASVVMTLSAVVHSRKRARRHSPAPPLALAPAKACNGGVGGQGIVQLFVFLLFVRRAAAKAT